MDVPQHLVDTINTLLAPYGRSYSPDAPAGSSAAGGYVNYRGAAKYTGLSVSTLRRAVKAGDLPPPYRPKVEGGDSRAALFSHEQLDKYVRGLR